MERRFFTTAALLFAVFALLAGPTLEIKLDSNSRNRNAGGGRRRTSGLGVQIGRGRGIQVGRSGSGRGSARGGGLSVGGRREDASSSRRPPPRPFDGDSEEVETERVGVQNSDRLKVSVAVVLPYSVFKKKSYTKKIIQVVLNGLPPVIAFISGQPRALSFVLCRRRTP